MPKVNHLCASPCPCGQDIEIDFVGDFSMLGEARYAAYSPIVAIDPDTLTGEYDAQDVEVDDFTEFEPEYRYHCCECQEVLSEKQYKSLIKAALNQPESEPPFVIPGQTNIFEVLEDD